MANLPAIACASCAWNCHWSSQRVPICDPEHPLLQTKGIVSLTKTSENPLYKQVLLLPKNLRHQDEIWEDTCPAPKLDGDSYGTHDRPYKQTTDN